MYKKFVSLHLVSFTTSRRGGGSCEQVCVGGSHGSPSCLMNGIIMVNRRTLCVGLLYPVSPQISRALRETCV